MKRILTTACVLTISFTGYAAQNILIYEGPGAGPKSVANTLATIKTLVTDQYIVKTVGAEELKQQAWLQDTALLIMPGGADRPYLEKLAGQGNANIKRFVTNGGKYIGICAGAYYSADHIEFAKGDQELEVTGMRELKFFPGLVEGPTYPGFDHTQVLNVDGMRAAQIYWLGGQPFKQAQKFSIFYNGGGHFVNAEKYSNVTVLARYAAEPPSQTQQPAAIVECQVGKGRAILSGPHFEWDPATLEGEDQKLSDIKAHLTTSNQERLLLARHLLNRLAIATN